MVQIHKEFTDSQVKELVERSLKNEIERKYTQEVLDVGKTRFFALVKEYRKDPNRFSIQYTRNSTSREIPHYAEDTIIYYYMRATNRKEPNRRSRNTLETL
jgi:hypothetical protein